MDQFQISSGYLRRYCRECANALQVKRHAENPDHARVAKAWRLSNPQRVQATKREWNLKNRDKIAAQKRAKYAHDPARFKTAMRKNMYGLLPGQYEQMLAAQGGVCAVCKEVCRTGRGLSVDHNHATKKIRGLLCHSCNCALGLAKDRSGILRALADYVDTRG